MFRHFTVKLAILFACLAIVALELQLLQFSQAGEVVRLQIESPTDFIPVFEKVSSAEAYQLFLEWNSSQSVSDVHLAAHLAGESLYDVYGNQGISACDESYDFGCYHGFFTKALSTDEKANVRELARACETLGDAEVGACLHGIGHGLVEYYGPDDLTKALMRCKETPIQSPLSGCVGGVFMEFNLPVVYFPDGTVLPEVRAIHEGDYYWPCFSEQVPVEFRDACIHELPQWWSSTLPIFEDAIKLCEATPISSQVFCFEGIGKVLPDKVGDVAAIKSFCNLASDDSMKKVCQTMASWRFYYKHDLEKARALCSDVRELSCPVYEELET